MSDVFVEPHPKGKRTSDSIKYFVVEDRANHVLATFDTQAEAISWARTQGYVPHVARVRYLNDKKKPDQWRELLKAKLGSTGARMAA